MVKNFNGYSKPIPTKEVGLSKLIKAIVPSGYRDLVISGLNQDLETVMRWSEIGDQFNLGQWVKDNDWQIKLFSGEEIPRSRHIRNIIYSCKNILIIIFIYPLLVASGQLQELFTRKNIQNKKSWLIGYSVSGSKNRIVRIKSNSSQHQSFSITFSASGFLPASIFRIFSFSDYFASLYFFLKSGLRLKLVKTRELSYFFKEILDPHCFLHCMISFAAARNKVRKISIVSEGFPREKCLYASKSVFIERVNVSPTINLQRPNTLFWNGIRYLSEKYEIDGKKNFLEKLPTYKKDIVSLDRLAHELNTSNSRVIIVAGYSLESLEKMNSFHTALKNELSSERDIIFRDHPRRVSGHQIDPKESDIVLACTTTQYAVKRHLSCKSTMNFHIATGKGVVWDPAPYLGIPLVMEQK